VHQRSWLSKVKNIYELGAWNSCRKDWERLDFDFCESKGYQRLQAHRQKRTPVDAKYQEFFNDGMHDAWIVADRRENDYRLWFACRWANELGKNLAERVSREIPETLFTIEVICRKVHCVRWAESTFSGNLKFWNPVWKRFEGATSEFALDEDGFGTLANDWLYTEQDRLQWILRCHSPVANQGTIYGMIDCEEITVVDHRERQLKSVFGESTAEYWREFLNLSYPDQYLDNECLPDIILD
jgi:hypothetical protein